MTLDLKQVREKHRKIADFGAETFYCGSCTVDWPCDAIQLADAYGQAMDMIYEWESHEGPVCPEDAGFEAAEELLDSLRKQLADAQAEQERVIARLGEVRRDSDERLRDATAWREKFYNCERSLQSLKDRVQATAEDARNWKALGPERLLVVSKILDILATQTEEEPNAR